MTALLVLRGNEAFVLSKAAPMTSPPRAPLPLLPRIAKGDELALRECLRRYGPLVASLARKFLRNAADVDDACQDIFLALWKNASAFDPERAAETTFVAMLARRRLIDRLRAAAVRVPLPPSDACVESDTLDRYLDARIAVAGLTQCSEDQRKVILLASHGLTHAEIAEEMGIPLGTVKSHYTRGIDLVKKELEKRTVAS